MKSVLFVQPVTTGSHMLSMNHTPIACDWLALADWFRERGFEIYLHNPYKKRKSDFPESSNFNNFNCLVLNFQQIQDKLLKGKLPWKTSVKEIYKELIEFNGPIFIPFLDGKKRFRAPWESTHPLIRKVLEKSIVIYPVDPNLIPNKPLIPRRYVVTDFFSRTPKFFQDKKDLSYCPYKEYDFVYAGYSISNERKKKLEKLIPEEAKCLFIGKNVSFRNYPVINKIISQKDLIYYIRKSKFQLVVGENCNPWVTPRVYQSAIYGSLVLVDKEYNKAAELFPNQIVKNKKDVKEFMEKSIKELSSLYEKQLYT